MSVDVLTRSFNNARTGANTQETVLTPDSVHNHGLRKLFSLHINDDKRGLEAQPLIATDIVMPDGKKHDVVYLATMGNRVWAFDANTGQQLWNPPVVLGNPVKGGKAIDLFVINDHWGVISTPVIDKETQTLYVVNWTSPDGDHNKAFYQLHALSLSDGKPRHPAINLEAQEHTVGGKTVKFIPSGQKQRSALLLSDVVDNAGHRHRTLFVACGSVRETAQNAHGWVLAFDTASFKLTGVYNTTPGNSGGGIWQAGQGPAADSKGHIYALTGNGSWDGVTNFSESVIKLVHDPTAANLPDRLTIRDWFTPFTDKSRKPTQTNHRGYDWSDQDLGSGGAVLIESMGLVIGCGKDGVIYVVDQNKFGKTSPDDLNPPSKNYAKLKSRPIWFTFFPGFAPNPAPDDPQELNFNFANRTHHQHGTPVFWDSPDRGPMLFCWGENGNLRVWNIDASGKVTYLAACAEVASGLGGGPSGLGGMPGGMLCLSANNNPHTGLVWGLMPIDGDANQQVTPGILRVYDATEYDTNPDGSKRMRLLWDSKHFGTDQHFNHNKFGVPVVANGKVYVPTYDGRVDVYGLA